MFALLDPFSGIAGDMLLGALVDVGLDPAFIERLPATLGLENIGVRIERTMRCGISAVKVDFAIPPQPHGRHLRHLIEIVDRAPAPDRVKRLAADAFRLIATVEAEVHGTTVERVHLHEVGAVDAILDVVGVIWGFETLGIDDIRCGTIALGDGHVDGAHGRMPVPAPATARLLEGLAVRSGPPESGELTTPTGASLVRVLSRGGPPAAYTPRRSGHGAGTKTFADRPNVLRVMLADAVTDNVNVRVQRETLVMLTTDIDDMSPEHLAAAADALRTAGALDVTLTAVVMKKGRLGTRFEVLAMPETADSLECDVFMKTSSIGVRRTAVSRSALGRRSIEIRVLDHILRVKLADLPDGSVRAKPESDDVSRVALATGQTREHIFALAMAEARRTPDSV